MGAAVIALWPPMAAAGAILPSMSTRPVIPQQDLETLRARMEAYAPLGQGTWEEFVGLCRSRLLAKGDFYVRAGEVPTEFGFLAAGLIRVFVSDEDGDEYNKVFFEEGGFPGSMAALLGGTPSRFGIQALEPTRLVSIDFAGFRDQLQRSRELLWFQVRYLEENWLMAKEAREVPVEVS